jgi:geranylgeranyl pyrophosphate synthase
MDKMTVFQIVIITIGIVISIISYLLKEAISDVKKDISKLIDLTGKHNSSIAIYENLLERLNNSESDHEQRIRALEKHTNSCTYAKNKR